MIECNDARLIKVVRAYTGPDVQRLANVLQFPG